MSYSLDEKLRARELYVEAGKTYEQLSAETGISLSVLKSWGKEQNWSEEKAAFEAEVLALNSRVNKLKSKLLNEALGGENGAANVDPQKVYALANLWRATNVKKAGQSGEDRAALFLEFMGDLVDYLREKDQEALRHLQPHIRSFAETMKAT